MVIRYRNSKEEVSKLQPGQNVRSCQLRWLIVLCRLIPRQSEQVDVQVHFLKPLLYDEYKDMKTTEIAAIVKERIQCTINSSL